ncbi:hypothetical protein AADZ91_18230 [Colwelliaceae bacterium 6441]
MFENELIKDNEYQKFKSKKEFTARETAVEQTIVKVGEKVVGKLNKRIASLQGNVKKEKLQGELNLSKQQTKTALLFSGIASNTRTGVEMLLTPWGEQAKLISNNPNSNSPPEKPAVENSNVKCVAPKNNKQNESLEEAVPTETRPFLKVLSNVFLHATPLQTAIIFLLVIAGLTYWGEANKTQLKFDNDAKQSRIETLEKDIKELKEFKKQHESSEEKLRTNEIELSALNDKVDFLQTERKELKAEKDNLLKEHKLEIEKQRMEFEDKLGRTVSSTDEATTTLIADKDKQINEYKTRYASIELELKSYRNTNDKDQEKIRKLETEKKLLDDKVTRLTSNKESMQEKINRLSEVENNYLTLTEFSSNVFDEIERTLDSINKRNYKAKIKDFEDRYELWYSRNEENLKKIGVNEL